MHVEKFYPDINEVYIIQKHTLLHALSGNGGIQVDFNNYFDWKNKGIFLEKGQYIKFLSTDFIVRKIEFSDDSKFYNKEVRVLFKHLISLGYIDLEDCNECKAFLSDSVLADDAKNIIDVSSKQWYWQNPFNANMEEYQIIFDAKDIIDKEYRNNMSTRDLAGLINDRGYNAHALIKDKIGLSAKNMMSAKKLMESRKEIAFTDKSIQEISYGLGYKDDAYFNRVFKKSTGQTPSQFRDNFDYQNRDLFTQDIMELLRSYHASERSLSFYADKMNLSIKTLTHKVQSKMNVSLGQLIRLEIINTAKLMLLEGESVLAVSQRLGFEESNHFSRFFKHYTQITPTEFKNKKYNS